MNIFITGIAGVLGSTLKTELRKRGNNVYGCDLTHSNDPDIVRADVSIRRQLHEAMDNFGYPFDIVFHLAAEFGRINGEHFYEQLWSSNCIGTQNVIEECVRHNAKMVFASSSEAYGLSEQYSNGRALHEGLLDIHAPQYHNQYALSKRTNELQICTAARNNNLDAIILRFFNVFGPPEKFSEYRSVACQFVYKILAGLPVTVNKGGKRSHLWIGDWANTVANIADRKRLDTIANVRDWPGSGGTPYVPVFNIGGTEYESIDGLYKKVCDAVSKVEGSSALPPDVTFTDTEIANSATKEPDCTLAREWLDHNPQMTLEQGLLETVRWTKKEYGL